MQPGIESLHMSDIRIGTSAFTAMFVEPMECESVSKLREGLEWVYERVRSEKRQFEGVCQNGQFCEMSDGIVSE